jgi:hypothetical protein
MPDVPLDQLTRTRAEMIAERAGESCKVCGSRDLLARDTGIQFGDGALRVYLDCAEDPSHQTGVSVQWDGPPPPPRRLPGESSPRA